MTLAFNLAQLVFLYHAYRAFKQNAPASAIFWVVFSYVLLESLSYVAWWLFPEAGL